MFDPQRFLRSLWHPTFHTTCVDQDPTQEKKIKWHGMFKNCSNENAIKCCWIYLQPHKIQSKRISMFSHSQLETLSAFQWQFEPKSHLHPSKIQPLKQEKIHHKVFIVHITDSILNLKRNCSWIYVWLFSPVQPALKWGICLKPFGICQKIGEYVGYCAMQIESTLKISLRSLLYSHAKQMPAIWFN